jgi:cell division transport system permease protein
VAAVIRHTLTEGWVLIRQRGLVGLVLALALAIPIGLAGVTLTVSTWLGPLAQSTDEQAVVAVLLHPQLGADERRQWLAAARADHPSAQIEEVPPELLRERLVHWFPYLDDLLRGEHDELMPRLVEVTTADPDSVAVLASSPAVIAVGPRSALSRVLRRAATGMSWVLLGLSTALLLAAGLLASVWVHLELYRHSDEITIMRLIGATEGAIRGPFLLAVVSPGLVAAALAAAGTVLASRVLTEACTALGLPPVTVTPAALAAELILACLLPCLAALITLHRHATRELD